MITASLIFLPLIAGLIIYAVKDAQAKYFALAAAIAEFILSLSALSSFTISSNKQFELNTPWITSMSINFHVGMDGISLLLALLTTFLVPLIILSAFRHNYSNNKLFYSLVLIMQSALIGVFVSYDAFLFYIFWELALIPIYFISLVWGGQEKLKITFKFFVYTLVGSLFMLLGIIYLYLQTPTHSFELADFYALRLSREEQVFIFWAFFLAFAIKMPVFPFHTWQPDTYTSSPTQGTMLLSGIMLKMGVYGAIRWMIPIVPIAMDAPCCGMLAVVLAVIGIIYASIIALMQKDFKRMLAYVSMAHVGVIAAGVFTSNLDALQGAVFQMLSHGVTVVGMFFVVDILLDRTKTSQISTLGGIRSVAPQFALYFIIILFGSIALPLTSGFVGEFLIFVGLFKYSMSEMGGMLMIAIAALSIILGAAYMLSSYQKIMLGSINTVTSGFKDLVLSEKAVLVPIVVVIIWMGVYPKFFLEISEPAVKSITDHIINYTSLK